MWRNMGRMSRFGGVLGGFILGTAGVSVLKSKVAQKAYAYITAGAMIAKDSVMETCEHMQANGSDIAAEAREIRDRYYAEREAEERGEETELTEA